MFVAGFARRQAQPEAVEIEVTVADARRCNRLRGLGVATCQCRTETGWLDCPPAAHLALLHPDVIRDCLRLAEVQPLKSIATSAAKTEASSSYTGDFCVNPACLSPYVVRTGTCLTCQVCGDSSGGCS